MTVQSPLQIGGSLAALRRQLQPLVRHERALANIAA